MRRARVARLAWPDSTWREAEMDRRGYTCRAWEGKLAWCLRWEANEDRLDREAQEPSPPVAMDAAGLLVEAIVKPKRTASCSSVPSKQHVRRASIRKIGWQGPRERPIMKSAG